MRENRYGGQRGRTVNLKGLARLGFDPFAIDVGDVFLEEGRVFELKFKGVSVN